MRLLWKQRKQKLKKKSQKEVSNKDFNNLKKENLSELEIVKKVLAQEEMWGENLNNLANATELVTSYLTLINEKGMKEALATFLSK